MVSRKLPGTDYPESKEKSLSRPDLDVLRTNGAISTAVLNRRTELCKTGVTHLFRLLSLYEINETYVLAKIDANRDPVLIDSA